MLRLYSGYDPSKPFQRSVNKRYVPDYYDVIKEPMALSVLKKKIKDRAYNNFSEFVRDCALVSIHFHRVFHFMYILPRVS